MRAKTRMVLAADGCVLGVADCPFAIARFILLLQEIIVLSEVTSLGWAPKQKTHMITKTNFKNTAMMTCCGRRATARRSVLKNEFGEISTQQDLSCKTECIVVMCCPSGDLVSACTCKRFGREDTSLQLKVS